ncbi:MAG: XRE family transcriptional regulator [Bacteroidota bacterium]
MPPVPPLHVLGPRLRALRKKRGLRQKTVAARAQVSASYLSEIEQGKKYPSPDKMAALADALGVPYDALAILGPAPSRAPAPPTASPLLEAFPFALFGVDPTALAQVMARQPDQAEALTRAFLDVMRNYDLTVEHFLFAALRSYQQLHRNYFEALEAEAEALRTEHGWDAAYVPSPKTLAALLTTHHRYEVDLQALDSYPDLSRLRSVYLPHPSTPRLLVNPKLMPSQQAFLLAREIGYVRLGIDVRPTTSTFIEIESFEQVLNHFKASYLGGALLMPRAAVCADLAHLFNQRRWDDGALRTAFNRYNATPEMLYYRLTELIPAFFGLQEIYIMRFNHQRGTDAYRLTKVFNMSRVPVPHGVEADEHYCRRWVSVRTLQALDRIQGTLAHPQPVIRAQRVRFITDNAEFFAIGVARPLALKPGVNSVVALGFLIDDDFRRMVRFWDDPHVPTVEVNLTCERCALLDCPDRAAAPSILHRADRRLRQRVALETLRNTLG